MKFDNHINPKIRKANAILGVIIRVLANINRDILITLYRSLVRPNLEYTN